MTTAVVLGPGGVVGTAWLAGLAAGLRRRDVDLGAADLLVGTSAGAIVAAALARGGDLERLATLPDGPDEGVRPDPARLAEVFAVLGDQRLERGEAVRRAGRIALAAATGDEATTVRRMRAMIGGDAWPRARLLIPAVDAETGEAVVWDRDGAASLPQAVAASTAFPATAPPVTVAGRRYVDGALRAGTNTDLAGDADLLIVAEPMAHVTGPDGRAAGVRLVPDADAVAAIGPDLGDRARWAPAFQAGLRQAASAAPWEDALRWARS